MQVLHEWILLQLDKQLDPYDISHTFDEQKMQQKKCTFIGTETS